MTEGASLYALCRSWLRNGSPEETQVHFILLPWQDAYPMVSSFRFWLRALVFKK